MSYNFSYYFDNLFDSGQFALSMLYSLFGSGMGILTYVLTAIGLYSIAKRRGIKHPWLSWIPVANCWILGCISDQYRYVVRGEVKSKRKVLLTLNIIMAAIYVILIACFVTILVNVFSGVMGYASEDEMIASVLGPVMWMLVICLPLMGVAIAYVVVSYMALYDLYTSCSPQNNVLFLVLSILISVTQPFFIFFIRKKDGGMPPRRPDPRYIPEQPQNQPHRDPWDQ